MKTKYFCLETVFKTNQHFAGWLASRMIRYLNAPEKKKTNKMQDSTFTFSCQMTVLVTVQSGTLKPHKPIRQREFNTDTLLCRCQSSTGQHGSRWYPRCYNCREKLLPWAVDTEKRQGVVSTSELTGGALQSWDSALEEGHSLDGRTGTLGVT